MRRTGWLLAVTAFLIAGACNPEYLPITTTGILTPDEVELGAYASFGMLGRKIRPTTFRGVVANFGLFSRKGLTDGIDWTMTLSTFGVTTAFGFAQDDEGNTVIRPRVGVGWMTGIVGVDWATNISEGPRTDYNAGGSVMIWIGDAFWTEDPGLSYGIRVGALGQVASEPRWRAPYSGGVRLDWAPLQFGGRGAPETLSDLIGGSRNPFGEPQEEGILEGWPRPRLAFELGAMTITGGPAFSFHRRNSSWVEGGEPEEE